MLLVWFNLIIPPVWSSYRRPNRFPKRNKKRLVKGQGRKISQWNPRLCHLDEDALEDNIFGSIWRWISFAMFSYLRHSTNEWINRQLPIPIYVGTDNVSSFAEIVRSNQVMRLMMKIIYAKASQYMSTLTNSWCGLN